MFFLLFINIFLRQFKFFPSRWTRWTFGPTVGQKVSDIRRNCRNVRQFRRSSFSLAKTVFIREISLSDVLVIEVCKVRRYKVSFFWGKGCLQLKILVVFTTKTGQLLTFLWFLVVQQWNSSVQCSDVRCSAVQCSAVAVQCSAVQCSAVQCGVVQCSSVQYSRGQCSEVKCMIEPCSSVNVEEV